MKNPVVVIVKGKLTGEDKIRNPLSAEYQEKLLKKVNPGVEVSISPNGFLPGILGYFRKQGKEVTKIYSGADRIAGYQAAINKANEKMPSDEKFNVIFKETERVTSATDVRNAIRSGDFNTFKRLVPKEIWDEWDTLQKILNQKNEEKIKSFARWLKEDALEGITTTLNIQSAQKDMKLGRRKKFGMIKQKQLKE